MQFFCSELESRVEKKHKDLTKIYARYETKEKCIKIMGKLKEKFDNYINVYMVSETELEIISNKTNKSSAIQELLKLLEISEENVYTIGDGYSDIKMIQDFNGYCMENSVDELKEICKDKVKASVSELIIELDAMNDQIV